MVTAHYPGEAARPSDGTTLLLAFGAFTLDVAGYRLSRDGQPIEVQPQTFDALRYLVEHRDRSVSAHELQREIWSRADTEKGAVWWTVYRLRRVLGQRTPTDGPIRTVGRRGYRFVAHVHVEVRGPLASRTSLANSATLDADASLPGASRLAALARRMLLDEARRTLEREGAPGLDGLATFAALADAERTRRALTLLEREDVSIATVAARVGYSSVPSFTRAFRSWIGTTPRVYRRDYAATIRASIDAGFFLDEPTVGAAE